MRYLALVVCVLVTLSFGNLAAGVDVDVHEEADYHLKNAEAASSSHPDERYRSFSSFPDERPRSKRENLTYNDAQKHTSSHVDSTAQPRKIIIQQSPDDNVQDAQTLVFQCKPRSKQQSRYHDISQSCSAKRDEEEMRFREAEGGRSFAERDEEDRFIRAATRHAEADRRKVLLLKRTQEEEEEKNPEVLLVRVDSRSSVRRQRQKPSCRSSLTVDYEDEEASEDKELARLIKKRLRQQLANDLRKDLLEERDVRKKSQRSQEDSDTRTQLRKVLRELLVDRLQGGSQDVQDETLVIQLDPRVKYSRSEDLLLDDEEEEEEEPMPAAKAARRKIIIQQIADDEQPIEESKKAKSPVKKSKGKTTKSQKLSKVKASRK